jgi:hypothetical protein
MNGRCSINCGQKEFDTCCSGHTCSNGLVCFFNEVSNICKQCGTFMDPCCPGKKCDGELPGRMLFCKPSPLTGGDGICDINP